MKKHRDVFTVDLLVLSILNRGDNYVYEMYSIISEESKERLNFKEGVLYTILYKLMDEKCVSKYKVEVDNRTRIYYHIEEKGIEKLKQLIENYQKSVEAINEIIYKEVSY